MLVKPSKILVVAGVLAMLGIVPGCQAAPPDAGLQAVPVPVGEDAAAAPGLRFKGAIALTSGDPRFGGLSGLLVEGDRVTAVSDHGFFVELRLEEAADGTLVGAGDLSIRQMQDAEGKPLEEIRTRDSEEITRLPNGDLAVIFERFVRIGIFPPGAARMREQIPLVGLVPQTNEAIEAMVALPDGRLLLIAERAGFSHRVRRAWIGRPGAWEPLTYRSRENLEVAGAALLPSGDLLVLERGFSPLLGFSSRLVLVRGEQVRPGGVLDGTLLVSLVPPYPSDNYEGIAVRREGGHIALYVISDDNYFWLQRTLLLKFEWPDRPWEAPAAAVPARPG
jgi:hypothetical protein